MSESQSRSPRETHRPGRIRPADRALLVTCSIVVTVSLLLWTGVVPSGLYPASPVRWSLSVSTCASNASYVQQTFPLWAPVHVSWTAKGGDVWYMVQARGITFLSQTGTNGSGSFVSDSYPLAFWALSLVPVDTLHCSSILVNTTATFTV